MNVKEHPVLHPALTTAWLLRQSVAPARFTNDGTLEVLTSATPPENHPALDTIGALQQCAVAARAGDRQTIRTILMNRAAYMRESVSELIREDSTETGMKTYRAGSSIEPHRLEESGDLSDQTRTMIASGELLGNDPDDPKVIRLVNAILAEAVRVNASDVHLEPDVSGLNIRYRIDGLLEDYEHVPAHFREPVISRVKVMSKLDISIRQKPQDGAFDVTFGGRPLDVRVSTVPTPAGQRVVMRLLDRSGQAITFETLGMPQDLIRSVESILKQSQGLLLVAGPTGSGKTTTLYACLNRLDIKTRNTITIEDPVEYHVPGVSQIQVGRERNLGFADGLRSVLRQDPDVIMVGEIRDRDTAAIALQAGLTGHLILTTIHTTDPAAAVIRLLDLGVDPPLIAETLSGVMDQRLVRVLCSKCKHTDKIKVLQATSGGCPECRYTGFSGRTGLFRFMSINETVRQAIRASDHQTIRDIVNTTCGNDLTAQAARLIETGVTTPAETGRVIGNADGV
jgi:general secretion pathway protein E